MSDVAVEHGVGWATVHRILVATAVERLSEGRARAVVAAGPDSRLLRAVLEDLEAAGLGVLADFVRVQLDGLARLRG